MNDHPPLEPVGDASLEARIVAWVLGEASAFEAGELERLCDERPELLVFRRRMRALHGLLSEAESAEADEAWKLPPDKRAKIEELFGESQPEQDIPILQSAAPSRSPLKPGRLCQRRRSEGPTAPSRWLVKTILTAAACAMFGMLYRFGFEERSSMKVAAKSVDFLPSEARTRIAFGGVEITGGSSFEVAPQSPVTESHAWHGRSDENGRIAGDKQSQASFAANRKAASGADYSYKAKAAQAVAETESLADASKSKLEVIREFNYPNEYQPPELPNPVVPPNASLLADATNGGADVDFDGFANQGSPVNQAGQADETTSSQDKGAKLAARPPASKAKPGVATGGLAFASGSESSFSRFATAEGAFAGQQLESGDKEPRQRRQEVWGESQVKDRVSRREIQETPATPTGGFKNDLAAADSLAEPPIAGKDRFTTRGPAAESKPGEPTGLGVAAEESPSDLALGTSDGQAMDLGQAIQRTPTSQTLDGGTGLGFGFGDGSGGRAGNKAPNAAIDDVSSLGLETNAEETVASDVNQITGSLAVTGKSELGDMEGAKSQVADGPLNGNGTIVTGSLRSGDGVITRGNVDASLNNPNRAENPQGTPVREDVAKLDRPAAIPAPAAIAPPAPPVTAAPAKPAAANAKASEDTLGRTKSESGPTALEDLSSDAKETPKEESNKGLTGLAQREMVRRGEAVTEGDRLLMEGRDAFAKGDYKQAVERYHNALEKIPNAPLLEDRRKSYEEHLTDANVALAQQYRKFGKYDEAKALLGEVLKPGADPENADAKRELAWLQDPLRTNPALDDAHTENVNQVRKGLYLGEGNFNLGKFDDAKREYESVLRTDPNNSAARRGLERVASAQSDYYRAAYDQTRSQLLMQVDKAWEKAVPDGGVESSPTAMFENPLRNREDDRGAGSARDIEYMINGEKTQLESQINNLLNYSDDQLLTYASGPDLPDNSVKSLYPTYLEQKRAIDALKNKGFADEHPDVKAQQQQLETTKKQLDEGVANLRETLKAQKDMAIERLAKVKTLSSEKKGEAIDTAVDAQDYIDAKIELDSAQEMLNTMKMKLLGETIQERIPSSSIVVHEDPVIEKPGWLSLDRRYQSSTAVQVKPRNPGITVLGKATSGASGQPVMSPQFFATEFEIVKSKDVLMRVAEQLNLSNKWEIPKEKVVEELQKSITVSNRPGTDLIDIKVKNDDAGTARDVAAEVAKAYKNHRTEIETKDSERALQELRKAVRAQEEKVEERRKLMTTIARTKGIVPTAPTAEANKLQQSKSQLEDQIKNMLTYTGDQLLAYASSLDLHQNVVKELYPQYLGQKRKIDQLKTQGMAEDHPSYLAQAEKLRRMKKEMEEAITVTRETLMAQLDMADDRLGTSKILPRKPAPIPTDEISASGEAFSTFSLHVSDASFKVAKAAMDRGERPDPESVRPEEFYNAFDYGDPTPAPGEPVACAIEQAAHPILPQRNLVRIAMRTGAAGRAASQPLNLTVLLDHSGSMEREDRHEGLNQAIVQLASLLKAGDTITVAGFSRTPRLMADRLPGERAKELIDIVRNTPSEGGTNLEEALKLGGDLALRQKNPAAQNRIVLLTDGAANLGNAKPEDLAERIRALRQQGISFDAAGLGAGGVNDRMLETLTRDGNGRYYLIDQPSDADANFAKQLAGAFRPAAENVKVQVHFNPARVGRYKLIGFEKHRLKTEDFRNDKVDAAELAAEEAGVALYQVETLPLGTGEIGEASVRFKDTSTGQMVEQTWTIPYDEKAAAFDQATPSMQLASLAALAAEKLRGGPLAEATDFQSLTPQVAKVRAHYATSKKVGDLIEMIGKLK